MRTELAAGIMALVIVGGVYAIEDYNVLPKEAKAALEEAEKYELFSLEPAAGDGQKDGFHSWKILGSTVIKDAKVRAKIIQALESGVKQSRSRGAKCFDPRHGIRVTQGNKVFDFLICFECWYVVMFTGDKHFKTCHTTSEPQKVFDSVLKDANVPLAKPADK